MRPGFMYILRCVDDSYYTGSTVNLYRRLAEHQNGIGANHTSKHLPVVLVYFELYERIDLAFYREKQVQGWSRKKKEVLIERGFGKLSPEEATKRLKELSRNYTQYPRVGDGASADSALLGDDIEDGASAGSALLGDDIEDGA